jgi:hypothetical protein
MLDLISVANLADVKKCLSFLKLLDILLSLQLRTRLTKTDLVNDLIEQSLTESEQCLPVPRCHLDFGLTHSTISSDCIMSQFMATIPHRLLNYARVVNRI